MGNHEPLELKTGQAPERKAQSGCTHQAHTADCGHVHSKRFISYNRGMREIAPGCHAWFEPPGSWGLCNSGVVKFGNEVLVIDTQVDVKRAKELREAVCRVAGSAEIALVVNTHEDGDHWNGNMLFEGAPIISTKLAEAGMRKAKLDPRKLKEAGTAGGPYTQAWVEWRLSEYEYEGWRPVYPTETFTGRRALKLGGTEIHLIQVGPAHSKGDAMVFIPEIGVLYTGDIIMHRSTPTVWENVPNFIKACDVITDLKPKFLVPGHGSLANVGAVRDVRTYLVRLLEHATRCFDAGDPLEQAYSSFDPGEYRLWPHRGIALQSIRSVYLERDPSRVNLTFAQTREIFLADDEN